MDKKRLWLKIKGARGEGGCRGAQSRGVRSRAGKLILEGRGSSLLEDWWEEGRESRGKEGRKGGREEDVAKCGRGCRGKGFPGGTSGKEPACWCRRHKWFRFDPWVRKIPWWRDWQPTPVFLPEESQGQRNLAGYSPWGHRVRYDCSNLACTLAPRGKGVYHQYPGFSLLNGWKRGLGLRHEVA